MYAECSNSCWQGPSCPDGCYDPSIELVYQTKAPDQLSYVAWPPTVSSELWWLSIGSPELSGGQQYYFDDSGGEHVPLYVYDTGATMSHSVSCLYRYELIVVIKMVLLTLTTRNLTSSAIEFDGSTLVQTPMGSSQKMIIRTTDSNIMALRCSASPLARR